MKLKSPKISKNKKVILVITASLVVFAALIIASFFLTFSINNIFPPATHLANLNLSYRTYESSLDLLKKAEENYLNTPITFTLGDESRKFTPKELGVEILSEKTLKTLKDSRKNSLPAIRWIFPSQKDKVRVGLLTKIDYEKMLGLLSDSFEMQKFAPLSANFFFENAKLTIQDGKEGFTINTENLLKDLKLSAQNLKTLDISLSSKKTAPRISKEDLEAKREEVESMLAHKMTLIDPIYSDDWNIKLIDHVDWIKFIPKQKIKFKDFNAEIELSGSTVEAFDGIELEEKIGIEVDQEGLNEFIDAKISKWLDKPSEDVKIYYNEDQKVIIEGYGNDGKKIQREQLKKAIELAVEEKVIEVPIPVLTIEPKITIDKELQKLGIKERLATGHTSYYGSPGNRVHNIKTGSTQFDGVLVAPDEVFSFNQTLGRVDGTTGYRKELVIKPEGTIPEYGGGLCQVSTTAYRGFLLAGLPIEERHEHSYAVSYYSQILGHGLDATIYLGGADLKFRNDTGHHLLLQMYTKNDYELYVVLYGTDDGRTTELDGPYLSNYHNPGPTVYIDNPSMPAGTTKQIEKAHTGFNALWYRYITKPDGEIIKETITTRYKAVPNRIIRGTGQATSEEGS